MPSDPLDRYGRRHRAPFVLGVGLGSAGVLGVVVLLGVRALPSNLARALPPTVVLLGAAALLASVAAPRARVRWGWRGVVAGALATGLAATLARLAR